MNKYILIGLLVMVLFIAGCKSEGLPYYQSNGCKNCTADYYCMGGELPSQGYCIRKYQSNTIFINVNSGLKDFENDVLKCNETIEFTNKTYNCYQMRQIIELSIDVAPREVKTTKVCNYPSYNKVTTSNEGDWKQIYLKECIEGD